MTLPFVSINSVYDKLIATGRSMNPFPLDPIQIDR